MGTPAFASRIAFALCVGLALSMAPARGARAQELKLEARMGTEFVDQGVPLTRAGPGFWLHGEYGGDAGWFAGLDAHNIDVVPDGEVDRNLFIRVSPYVGWNLPLSHAFRLRGIARYVLLPEAVPHDDYAVFELHGDWRGRAGFSINHSANRFGRGVATTSYELNGIVPIARGFALRGVAGRHDFDAIGGDDYSYAGIGLVASSARYDLELAYHVLDDAGDRMFDGLGGEPGLVLSLAARNGDAPPWAADGPSWLERVSLSGELRSRFISSGVSQTFDAPAVQLAFEVATRGGTYAEIWGSNVDYTAEGEILQGADSEVDYTLGHRFTLSKDWKLTARASYYTYPGALDREDRDEVEYLADVTWRDRLRLKAGITPDVAGVHKTRLGFTARWKQPLGAGFDGSLEVGHKNRGDWGVTYNWAKAELSRPVGKLDAILRYWTTSQSGRKADGTADPAFEFALGWAQ